jgi:hypothetical protein
LTRAVAALRRAGAEPLKQSSESAWFAVGERIVLEITRDSDSPDAFWCPMHPEVRSTAGDKCPICSMELVPIPPSTPGHYQLDVTQIPRVGGKGVSALQLEIRHPDSGENVTGFFETHERLLHLFIVRRDLSYFAHVHPQKAAGRFEVPVDLDPGAYVLIADFVPAAGAPQVVQRAIVTRGDAASPFLSPGLKPDAADKIVDGLRISLAADARVGRESVLRFTVRDAATGTPVSDLEAYLGAAGHLLAVNADVTEAIHAHPEGTGSAASRGPDVAFGLVLPAPGVYKLWVQFQRNGKVITAPFAVAAR